jgi:hypothetical protein
MLNSFIRRGLAQEEAESESRLQIYVFPFDHRKLPSSKLISPNRQPHSMAGSDTIAIALRATLLYISTSPRTLNTLRSEIDSFIAPKTPGRFHHHNLQRLRMYSPISPSLHP